jgi:AsmA protein
MRWIFRILVTLVLVSLVAVGMVFMLPGDKIGKIASDQLERMTGRKLTLSGRFSPTIYPVLGVKTGPITISNAPWAENPVMVQAEGAAIGVGLPALFGGKLDIRKMQLVNPVIHLEKAADGRVNWDFFQSGSPSQPENDGQGSSPVSQDISLELGQVVDGKLTYADRQSGEVIRLDKINISLSLPKDTDILTLSGETEFQGEKVRVNLELSELKQFLAGSTGGIDASGRYGGLDLGFVGRLGVLGTAPPMVDGRLTVQAKDTAPIAAFAGPLPDALKNATDLKLNGLIQSSLAGLAFDGTVALNFDGLPVEMALEATGNDDWAQMLAFDVAANLGAGNALALRFDGRVNGRKSTLNGAIDLVSNDFHTLMQALDIPLDTPKGTLRKLAVKGKVSANPSGAKLNKMRLQIDQNIVAGKLLLKLAKIPYVQANLTTKSLDLAPFLSDENAGNGRQKNTVGWSKEPLKIVGLDMLNADVVLKAKQVDLGVGKLGLTHIKLKLSKGLLTANLIDVQAFEGAMSGVLHLRGGKELAFDADVLAKDMRLKPLLSELLGIDRLTGTGTTKMKLSGQGANLYAVMNSLSGNGTIKFANGALRGIDLAAMMRNLKSAFGGFEGATEFTSMTGSFTLNKGVLENVDLSLVSPLFKATGKGKVGIGGRFMDYVVTPSTLNGDAQISVPVIITGSWDNLKFRPDLENLIDLVLQGKLKDNAEVQKAKAKLKKIRAKTRDPKKTAAQELRKKLAKELNTTATGEKALKKKAEEKVKEELGNTLLRLLK